MGFLQHRWRNSMHNYNKKIWKFYKYNSYKFIVKTTNIVYIPFYDIYDFKIFYCNNGGRLGILFFNNLYSFVFFFNLNYCDFWGVSIDNSMIYFNFNKYDNTWITGFAYIRWLFRFLVAAHAASISLTGRFYRWPRAEKEELHKWERCHYITGDGHMAQEIVMYKFNFRLAQRGLHQRHFTHLTRRRVRLIMFDKYLLNNLMTSIYKILPENAFTGRGMVIYNRWRRGKQGKVLRLLDFDKL